MTVYLVSDTPATAFAAIEAHFVSLGLDETVITEAAARMTQGVPTEHCSLPLDESNRLIGFSNRSPSGNVWLTNLAVDGPDQAVWESRLQAPLASAATTTINATRGDIEVPTLDGCLIVRPKSLVYDIDGLEGGNADELEPDYPVPEPWEQLTPGVPTEYPFSPDGYPLGWVTRIDDVRYVQEGTLAQLPTGNFNVPGTVGSLWRAVTAGGGLDPWDIGALYQVGDEVSHNGEDWRNRRGNNAANTPGTNASGWLQISNTPAPWYFLGNEGYPTPWQVTHNSRLWSNPSAGNFWEPGVALWLDIGPAP